MRTLPGRPAREVWGGCVGVRRHLLYGGVLRDGLKRNVLLRQQLPNAHEIKVARDEEQGAAVGASREGSEEGGQQSIPEGGEPRIRSRGGIVGDEADKQLTDARGGPTQLALVGWEGGEPARDVVAPAREGREVRRGMGGQDDGLTQPAGLPLEVPRPDAGEVGVALLGGQLVDALEYVGHVSPILRRAGRAQPSRHVACVAHVLSPNGTSPVWRTCSALMARRLCGARAQP